MTINEIASIVTNNGQRNDRIGLILFMEEVLEKIDSIEKEVEELEKEEDYNSLYISQLWNNFETDLQVLEGRFYERGLSCDLMEKARDWLEV